MPTVTVLEGAIATPGGWILGEIRFTDRILAIEGTSVAAPIQGQPLVIPGFVDLHIHGAAGADFMDGGGAAGRIARACVRTGTTSLLATTMTASQASLEAALTGIGHAMGSGQPQGARILGVHLEGPYIADSRLGAQPALSRVGSLAEIESLNSLAPIRVLTLAPELPGHEALIGQLTALGMRVQLGHSNASYEVALAAVQAGAAGFTHLYNAMSELHHRNPGMVGAALAHADYAEIIPDLLHVHPGAIQAALRAVPRLYCVSDGTAATGMPDGTYRLGSQSICRCMGAVRLANGSLAGSVLTMDQAFRNLATLGVDLLDAVRRVATFPADYLGETGRGRLAPGAWSDIVVLDDALAVQSVHVEGVPFNAL